jgi:hypothetical protein
VTADLSERAHVRTAAELAVLSVPLDSRVLLVGDDGSAAAALAARGCVVTAPGDVADVDPDARFDAAVLLGALDREERPRDLLRRVAACLTPEGRVVASARNATHGALRLAMLRGRLVGARYDRSGFERLFRDCGLAVVERLEVRRGLTDTEVDVEPAAFGSEVLAILGDDRDAGTYELVFVAQDPATAATASGPRSVAEALQDDLDLAEKALADRDARLAEVELSLATARSEVEAGAARRRELEEKLAERLAEMDAQSRQIEAAVMDLELKDGLALELRSQLVRSEEAVGQLRQEMGEAEAEMNARLAASQHQVGLLHQALARGEAALAAMQAARAEELNRVLAEAAQVRGRLESELAAIKGRAGYRLLERVNGTLGRLGPVAKGARWMARQLARFS